MDILTLELYDVTVSEALREISRVLEAHPDLALRILVAGEEMLIHNVQRYLDRQGRTATTVREGRRWRIDTVPRNPSAPPPEPPRPAPRPAEAGLRPVEVRPPVAVPALLLTRASLGNGNGGAGRRLLLGILRELDAQVPWVGLALEATELLEDPEALALLKGIQARGTPVRISRQSMLFPDGPEFAFEVIEDSQWQRLAGKGGLTII